MRVWIEVEGADARALWKAGVEALDRAIRRALAAEPSGGEDGGDPTYHGGTDARPQTGEFEGAARPSDP